MAVDGFVAARELLAAGREVRLLLLAEPESLSGDAAASFASLRQLLPQDDLMLITDEAALRAETVVSMMREADVVIDAGLGAG